MVGAYLFFLLHLPSSARVAKLVDAADSKSAARKGVSVRLRSRARKNPRIDQQR